MTVAKVSTREKYPTVIECQIMSAYLFISMWLSLCMDVYLYHISLLALSIIKANKAMAVYA